MLTDYWEVEIRQSFHVKCLFSTACSKTGPQYKLEKTKQMTIKSNIHTNRTCWKAIISSS